MDDYVEKLNNHPNVDDNVLTIFIHFWIRNIPLLGVDLVGVDFVRVDLVGGHRKYKV